MHPDRNGEINSDKCWIYLFYNVNVKAYKIGFTDHILRRYRQLAQNNKTNFVPILSLEISGYTLNIPPGWWIEKFLKKYYDKNKINGEWFNFTKSEIKDMTQLFDEIEGDSVYTNLELKHLLTY